LRRHKLSEDLHELFTAQLTAASKLAVAAFTAQLKKGGSVDVVILSVCEPVRLMIWMLDAAVWAELRCLVVCSRPLCLIRLDPKQNAPEAIALNAMRFVSVAACVPAQRCRRTIR
jgi:hypothetical protein